MQKISRRQSNEESIYNNHDQHGWTFRESHSPNHSFEVNNEEPGSKTAGTNPEPPQIG